MSPGEAEAFWEKRERQHDAKIKLASMKRLGSPIVRSWEELPARVDLSEWQIGYWRKRREKEYLESVGVPIEKRDEFQELLEEIAESGQMAVQQARDQVRFGLRKGLGERFDPAVGSPSWWSDSNLSGVPGASSVD